MNFMFAFESIIAIISAIILLVVIIKISDNSAECYAKKCKESS